VVEGRPGASMPLVDFTQLKKDLAEKLGVNDLTEKDVVSAAMFPKEFEEFHRFRQNYGPVDKLDTPTFFVGPDIAHEVQVLFSYMFQALYSAQIYHSCRNIVGFRPVFFLTYMLYVLDNVVQTLQCFVVVYLATGRGFSL